MKEEVEEALNQLCALHEVIHDGFPETTSDLERTEDLHDVILARIDELVRERDELKAWKKDASERLIPQLYRERDALRARIESSPKLWIASIYSELTGSWIGIRKVAFDEADVAGNDWDVLQVHAIPVEKAKDDK